MDALNKNVKIETEPVIDVSASIDVKKMSFQSKFAAGLWMIIRRY